MLINSSPIDETDTIRNIPAIGRELRFPIDINFNALPEMTRNNGHACIRLFKIY